MIADFEMLGLYGLVMSIGEGVGNVFVGSTDPSNRLRYNRETEAFELVRTTDLRNAFINTTGTSLTVGAGVVLEEIPSKVDIQCRAVPAE